MELTTVAFLLTLKETVGKDGKSYFKLGLQVEDDLLMLSVNSEIAQQIKSGNIPLHDDYTLVCYFNPTYNSLSIRQIVPAVIK